MRVSRRALLSRAGAAALGSMLPLRRGFTADNTKEYRLTAKPALVNLTGDHYPNTAVWSYDGSVPGPEIRVRQGDPVRIVVSNGLGEDTTVHWHGIRLPNAMDGVPGLTQKPIRPGESLPTSSRRPMPAPSGITRMPTACNSSGAALPAR